MQASKILDIFLPKPPADQTPTEIDSGYIDTFRELAGRTDWQASDYTISCSSVFSPEVSAVTVSERPVCDASTQVTRNYSLEVD